MDVRSRTAAEGSPRFPGDWPMKSMAYWARPRAWLVSADRVMWVSVATGIGISGAPGWADADEAFRPSLLSRADRVSRVHAPVHHRKGMPLVFEDAVGPEVHHELCRR